jgi:hypothetical protein
MSVLEQPFAAARRVADAVLYEGYLLYPYRASAQKNRLRWQFGVLAPRPWSEAGGGDPWASRTETLLEGDTGAVVHVRLRGLHLETTGTGWDEGAEREVDAVDDLDALLAGPREHVFSFPGTAGPPSRQTVVGRLRLAAERLPGPYGVIRLRVDTENVTDWGGDGQAPRDEAVRRSLVSTHLLIGVAGGHLLSVTDPPEWARPAAEACVNEHTWPVLLGGAGDPPVVLSSPIVLPDGAEVAPESPGDLFDATEIDEILSLRTLALTDEEKAEARATDARAAAIVDRTELMPAEIWERLHGAVRLLRPAAPPARPEPEVPPWWDPGADASVSPETDGVEIGATVVVRGSRVRLRPGRADAQDMFLAGRVAVVEAVLHDVDGATHLAVHLEDDPGADLMRTHGRFLYFHPHEVEPL